MKQPNSRRRSRRKRYERIIIDTHRIEDGHTPKYKAYERTIRWDEDSDTPERGKMRRPFLAGYSGKIPGDRLRPLKRFLAKNAGRPWDDVYSELLAGTDHRRVDGTHLRQHIDQYVNRHGSQQDRWSWREYYVDDNGILRHAPDLPRWRRRSRKEDPNTKVIDGKTYWRDNGVWFLIDFVRRHTITGEVLKAVPEYQPSAWFQPELERRKLKTLSKRELKQLGLR